MQDDPNAYILIRKIGSNLHKYDTKNKNLPRILDQQHPYYIDPIDREMILHKHKLDSTNYKQPVPKWYNIAWDGYRAVENHSKAMIF